MTTKRTLGAALVVSLGLGLAGLFYLRFSAVSWEPFAGVVAPLGLSALLICIGGWLFYRRVEGADALRVALATLAGVGVFGLFAVVLTLDLLPKSTSQSRAALVALNFASVGGAVGVLVGLFAARQASTIRALRDREAELRQSRDEYRDLFDGIGDAVLVHDTRGTIRAANRAAVERLGYEETALEGRQIKEIERDAPEDRSRVEGNRLVYEAEHRTDTERGIPVEVSAQVIRHRGERAVLSVARDITERRASERALARKRDQLQALNRIVRHDIRNDIQVILTLAEIVEDEVEGESKEHLRTIVDTSEYIVELTRSSGEIARTVTDEGEPSLKPVSLDATVRTEVDRRENAFDHAEFRVDDLPEVEVLATDLLSSVFRNLLNNAVRHNDRDDPTVEVWGECNGDRAVVRVADDGPGVPDEHKQTIFSKGEKGLDSEGTGLGLYLVESLVDRYGGDVWIEDNEPRGAVFAVELPVVS